MAKNQDCVYYYFGRLNLICLYYGQEKINFIRKSLDSNNNIKIGNFMWGLFNIESIEYKSNNFIFGLLVKYIPQADQEIADPKSNILKVTTVPGKTVAKSPFVLHLSTGIIAYHPIPGFISSRQFKDNFCNLIEAANQDMFVDAEMQPINDETNIFEAIKSFSKITALTISLHPSNPTNRRRWEKTDEKLQKMKAEKYYESYKSEKGLIIEDEDEVYGNILMAGDGYGVAKIEGYNKHGEKNISSTEKISKRKLAPKENPKLIIHNLFPSFDEVFRRFKKK